MTQELLYTSAPKGLAPGSHGFCTVAATAGFPASLMQKVEALSGYRPLYPPHDPQADLNPVVWSHVRVSAAGKNYHVLSRICAAGLDYTQRSNKFAHHIILENHELTTGGPAWLLAQPGFMEQAWDGQVQTLPEGRPVPRGDGEVGVCKTWQAVTGDAGWAGVLAESLLSASERLVYLLFEPGMDLLALLTEALALLPPARRWEATFSTYFAKTSQSVTCACRGVLNDSAEAKDAQRLPDTLVLNLCAELGQAKGGALVERARTGRNAAPQAVSPPPIAIPRGERMRTESLEPVAVSSTSRPRSEPSAWPSRAGHEAGSSASQSIPPPVPAKKSVARDRSANKGGWLSGFTQGTITGFLLSLAVLTGMYFLGGFTLVRIGTKADERLATASLPNQFRPDPSQGGMREEGATSTVQTPDKKAHDESPAKNASKPDKDGGALKPPKQEEPTVKKEKGPAGELKARVCEELPVQPEEEKLIAPFPGDGSKCKFVCDDLEFMYEDLRAKLLPVPDKDGQIIEYELKGKQEGPEELARLSVSKRGVSLKWSRVQNKAAQAARKHLRNGLLEITAPEGDKSYWALRRPIEEEWNFSLATTPSLTRALVWKDQDRPSGVLRLAPPGLSIERQPLLFQASTADRESFQRVPGPPARFPGARDDRLLLQNVVVKVGKDMNSIIIELTIESPAGIEEPAKLIWPKIHLDGLVVYTEISGIRVDVVHFSQKGKP